MSMLQTDPEKRPVKLGMSDVLYKASLICTWLEECGMTDKSSSTFKVTDDLIGKCAISLKSPKDVVKTYLANLGGLSPQLRGPVFRAAMRMSAQRAVFRRGICSTASPQSTVKPHWAGAYLVDCEEYFDEVINRLKVKIRFLVTTGPAAGSVIQSSFPKGFLYVLRQDIGAVVKRTRKDLDVYYGNQEMHYTNLCQVAIFLRTKQEICVDKVSATSSMLTYNRKLVRSRLRVLSPCPFNLPHDCVKCNANTLQCSRSLWIG